MSDQKYQALVQRIRTLRDQEADAAKRLEGQPEHRDALRRHRSNFQLYCRLLSEAALLDADPDLIRRLTK